MAEFDAALQSFWADYRLVPEIEEAADDGAVGVTRHLQAAPPNTGSACDTCSQPGVCCKDFPLIGGPDSTATALPTLLHAMVWASQQMYYAPDRERMLFGLPFIPHERDVASDRLYWHCVNLLPDGRCGDYDNRPHGPCVTYHPGEDAMCTLHKDFPFPERRQS